MTRVLADENIPKASIDLLRSGDIDVLAVTESKLGASDADTLALARSERRLLLTFDRDFGELIYRRGHPSPPGVVYFLRK